MDKRKKDFLLNISLVLVSILFTLLALELIVRDYHQGFQNVILTERGTLLEHYFHGFYSYDAYLGWVPTAHTADIKWDNHCKVTILNDGIRSNGNPTPPKIRPLIMAVGDSFTFGDQVADNETWPSFLERMTGSRVLNAGVSSYGLDQTILRAEQLVSKYKPDILIVSLIFDDLDRCFQSVRHAVPKPYFLVKDNQLVLKNVPTPSKPRAQLDLFRRIFGYSHLANAVMDRIAPYYWWKDTVRDTRYVKSERLEVVKLLFRRMENSFKNKTRVIVLIEGNINVNITQYKIFKYVFKCIPSGQVEICDLIPYLVQLKDKNRQKFNSFYIGHMTPLGNAWVAQMVKEKIAKED